MSLSRTVAKVSLPLRITPNHVRKPVGSYPIANDTIFWWKNRHQVRGSDSHIISFFILDSRRDCYKWSEFLSAKDILSMGMGLALALVFQSKSVGCKGWHTSCIGIFVLLGHQACSGGRPESSHVVLRGIYMYIIVLNGLSISASYNMLVVSCIVIHIFP